MSREYPCIYYDNQKCTKDPEPGVINWCVMGPCTDETPSNADRIRAMSDEELAKIINKYAADNGPRFCRDLPECNEDLERDTLIPLDRCEKCVLHWLRQPAQGAGT